MAKKTLIDSTPKHAHAKALAINLSNAHYGTFAEIGAGQEVARWFLQVGAASGSVAQTCSAYDKTFSDDTYGASSRYVSRERLLAMLDREYDLLLQRLGPSRGATTRFFVFADTVAARNFKGDNLQHGWMGVRFQVEPNTPPNDILLHIHLQDPTALRQQEAIGLLGVNLIYAAFQQRGDVDTFLSGLFDQLSIARLEIDVIELHGPALESLDAREWCLCALARGMSHAIAFDMQGKVTEPSNLLHKRPVVIERGRFVTIEPIHAKVLQDALCQLHEEGLSLEREPTGILELSIHHVSGETVGTTRQILSRVEQLTSIGNVIVSDYPQTYLLIDYLRRFTAEPIRIAISVAGLAHLLRDTYYNELPGTLLEGLGKLLASNVKIYVSPMDTELFNALVPHGKDWSSQGDGQITAGDLQPPSPLNHLYKYIREAGWVVCTTE